MVSLLCLLCVVWGVERGHFLLGKWFSFDHPASTSGTLVVGACVSFIICINVKARGCLWWSLVMFRNIPFVLPLGTLKLRLASFGQSKWDLCRLDVCRCWEKSLRVVCLTTLHNNTSGLVGRSSVRPFVLNHPSEPDPLQIVLICLFYSCWDPGWFSHHQTST